jgi:hypothetical protein
MSAIQPKILTWARQTAGLSLDDAARALGLTDAARSAQGYYELSRFLASCLRRTVTARRTFVGETRALVSPRRAQVP